MPAGAITLAVGAYSAYSANKNAKKAAGTMQGAADSATAEQQRQFDITQQNMAPWLQTGRSALDKVNALLGGDTSEFLRSPDYTVARDEGLKSLDRSLAARGALGSGGGDADRITFASNLGTQALGNYRNWLAGLSNTGQSTANTLGNFGQNLANQTGENLLTGAKFRASSYQQQADNNQQLAGVIGGGFNNWLQGRGATNSGPGTLSGFGNNMGTFTGGWRV